MQSRNLRSASEPPAPTSNPLTSGTTELRTSRTVPNELDILRYWVE